MVLICRPAVLLLAALASGAAQTPPGHPPLSRAGMDIRTKVKAAPGLKVIDINSASKDQLMQLPGVTEELAARIVKGRPYRTKANLLTHKVLPAEVYEAVKKHVQARQPGERKQGAR